MIINGDCLTELTKMTAQSCQCCVTSPPYWGLRDYGVDGQIGLEKTPEEYVAKLCAVFSEVWRVLKDDGTLWLNLGDCYATGAGKVGDCPGGGKQGRAFREKYWGKNAAIGLPQMTQPNRLPIAGLKPKDLVGIPWRVAFALQAAGWYLRSDIIWHKPNPMPESVTDRPTKAHEYIFLLTKSVRYYYDADAIAEPASLSMAKQVEEGYAGLGLKDYESNGVQNPSSVKTRIIENARKKLLAKKEGPNSRIFKSRDPQHEHEYSGKQRQMDPQHSGRRILKNCYAAREAGGDHDSPFGLTRNKRTVWTVTTHPYRDAHFATFPPDLIKPCILAGCPIGGTVLDPFGGSGTTGQVAIELGRKAVLIELNPNYSKLIEQRTNVTPGLAM